MNANRISGPGTPDANKPADQKIQREAAQRVEKVREVDPDEQTRQQRFKQMMQTEPEPDETEEPSNLPSPFEASFYKKGSHLQAQSLPSPSYSSPPNLSGEADQTLSDEDLPQSGRFWKRVDISDQPIEKPHVKELHTTGKAGEEGQAKTGKESANEHLQEAADASLFGLPGKSSSKKPKELEKKGSDQEEKATPSGRYWTAEGDLSSVNRSGSMASKTPAKEKKQLSSDGESAEGPSQELFESPLKGFSSAMEKADLEKARARVEQLEGEKKDKEKKQNKIVEIVSPSLPQLPPTIQPAALNAADAASPYLRPESLPLFYQMVGSILIMCTPSSGTSRTEITLNNPAFANSKFFGSTIEIIKYSSAPDSLNIRLTGTNEAVSAFNQNIPSLMAAFQTGHFNFRIGRIDAEYKADRPVLRRKHSKDEEGAGGDKQEEQH